MPEHNLPQLVLPEDRRISVASDRVAALNAVYGHLGAEDVVREVLLRTFRGRTAMVSSFGAESAALLHMVAEVAPATPIIFLDTGKHFGETLRYRDLLVSRLGFTNLQVVKPEAAALEQMDPEDMLFLKHPDRCCRLRKVLPLQRALAGFDAWITGRKSFQSSTRAALPLFEAESVGPDLEGRIKVNPLRDWNKALIEAYFAYHDLPRHPLEADGFLSIGCMTCTQRVAPGQHLRAGRWAGISKTECGIHL